MNPFVRPVVVVAALAVAALMAPGASGQSLADVARKEAERRGQVKDPARVISNADLRAVPGPPAASPEPPKPETSADGKGSEAVAKPGETGKAEAGKPSDKAKDKEPVKDQGYWAGRAKAAQEQLDRDETYTQALQTRINALTADFSGRDDPLQRAQIGRDRQKAMSELELLKKAVVADKKAISDLQEEARRSGVPPGWLRH